MKGNKLYHGYSENEIFKSEEDKMRILSMKEIEREKIIAERVEELNHKRERNELFQNNDNKKNIINKDVHDFSESEEAGEIKNERKKTENLESDNESCISFNDDDKQIKKEESSITLEDIEKIVLTRNFFNKYYNYPIFDENIKGALIRVNWSSLGQENIGYDESNGYAIGEIDQIVIKENQPYNFNGNKCTKYIKLMISDSDKEIEFTVISNSKILEDELKSWKKNRQKMPTIEEINHVEQNINKIKEYILKGEELNNILNKKKKDRIKYKDATLNVTEELDLAYEKYRYNKEKYEEAKQKEKEKGEKKEKEIEEEEEEDEDEDKRKTKENELPKETYLRLMKEAEEDIKQLEKMKEERDRKAKLISENDIVAKINEDIRRKQKMDEKLSLLSKKRKKDSNDKEHKIFKRVDCHPSTLFDSKVPTTEKKNEEKETEKENNNKEKNQQEEKRKKNSNNFCYAQKIKKLKEYIDEKKSLIDEMMEYEKSKKAKEEIELKEKEGNKNNKDKIENNIDMSAFFKLSSINYEMFSKMIKEQNKKNTIDPQVKIIGLIDYLKENNKDI